jgi:hypothetical protein
MQKQWTDEPWTLTAGPDPDIYGPTGECIVHQVASGAIDGDDDGQRNGQRIIACIHAMKGVSPNTKECGIVKDLLEAVSLLVEAWDDGDVECGNRHAEEAVRNIVHDLRVAANKFELAKP